MKPETARYIGLRFLSLAGSQKLRAQERCRCLDIKPRNPLILLLAHMLSALVMKTTLTVQEPDKWLSNIICPNAL